MKRMLHSAKLLCAVVAILFVGMTAARAQQRTLSGVVSDESGNPVLGVTVVATGTSAGTITGLDGAFSLSVPSDVATLQFSFLGMQTQEVAIGNTTSFAVTMMADIIGINDVVVVGYGTMAKKDISTAVTTVSAKDLTDRISSFNIMQSLSGKVAGLKTVSLSGRPGGNSAMRIRGMGSINAGKDPIYVLDGVIGVDPAVVNSANVESIEVLKDAAATAMYGSQGSNGVVLISTKRGQKGVGTMTYDGRVGVSTLTRRIDVLNAEEFMEVQRRAYAYSGKTMPHIIPDASGNPLEKYNKLFYYQMEGGNYKLDSNGNLIASPRYDTDWQSETTRPAITHDHILSFSKAVEGTSIYASASYQDNQGLVKETYSKRMSGTINISSQVNDWINVRSMLTAGSNQGNEMDGGFGQGPIRNMIEMPPIVPVRYDDGTWGRKNDFDLGEKAENPIRMLQERKNRWDRSFAVFNLAATLQLLPELTFTAQGDLQYASKKDYDYGKAGLYDYSENNRGRATLKHEKGNKMSSENYFNYHDTFLDDRLSSDFILGASWYYDFKETFGVGTEQYFDDFFEYNNLGVAELRSMAESGMNQKTMNSYYFRMNHSFMDRYLLGVSFRADGASNFGTNNKFGFFPSASAAWRISEEPFFEPLKRTVGELKLRASYGVVGNASIPSYRTMARYNNSADLILNNQLNPYVTLSSMANNDLRWEASHQFNIGLDVSLWGNRLEVIMDYYNKTTRDMLFEKQVPWSTGYANTWTNLGRIRNKGFEFTLTSRNISTRDFLWSTDLIYSTNKTMVIDINGETISTGNDTFAVEGQPWAVYWIYDRVGTWGLDEVEQAKRYNKAPGDQKFDDVNNDGKIDDADRKYMGSGQPKGDITMVNTFRYKNFSFMFDLNYVYGFKIMGITTTMLENRQLYGNSLRTVLNAWTPENQNSMIAALRLPSDPNFGQNDKDSRMLSKGDFLRIRNVQVSYELGDRVLGNNRKVIKGVALGLSVENLHVFTEYQGFDPEVGAFDHDAGSGIDFYSYPRPMTVSGNIKITF
ncbi:MAG: TonB-dependent receptor [Alistipes sp.]|jgi:TonB-linked SusC/RagA family outer membrane protein|nr:TonB-dependent receptor [Alistipes sp.]